MLGLIFTGGDKPDTQFIKQLIKTQVKDALYIAADSGLIAAENAGLKPDWIIGDMDSIKDPSILDSYPGRIIRYDHNKDFTDTELAFSLAIEKGCNDVWIIGGGGGRIDHLFGIRSLFERDNFPSRWITANEDIYCIDSFIAKNSIEKKLDKGISVSVFPLGDGAWEAQSSGLKWPLIDLPWDRGFFGLSNVAVDGSFSITAINGRFMIILPLYSSKDSHRGTKAQRTRRKL